MQCCTAWYLCSVKVSSIRIRRECVELLTFRFVSIGKTGKLGFHQRSRNLSACLWRVDGPCEEIQITRLRLFFLGFSNDVVLTSFYYLLFLDLWATFDSVNQNILVSCLEHVGVKSSPLSWLKLQVRRTDFAFSEYVAYPKQLEFTQQWNEKPNITVNDVVCMPGL